MGSKTKYTMDVENEDCLGKYFYMGNNFVEEMGLRKLRPCRICQHPCYYHYPGEEAFNLRPMAHIIDDIY